jgi:hypothetical protein
LELTPAEKQKHFELQKKVEKYCFTRNYKFRSIRSTNLGLLSSKSTQFNQFKFSRNLTLVYSSHDPFTFKQLSSGASKRLLKLLKYCTCLQAVTIKAKCMARLYLSPQQLLLMVRELVSSYKLLKLNYTLAEDMSSTQAHQMLKLLRTVRTITKFMLKLDNPGTLAGIFTDKHLPRLKSVLVNLKNLVDFDVGLTNYYQSPDLSTVKDLEALGDLQKLRSVNLNLYNSENIEASRMVDVLKALPQLNNLGLTLGKVLGIDDGGKLVNLLALTLPQLTNLEHLSLTLHCFHDLNLDAWCNLLTSLKSMPNLTRLTLGVECEPDMWNEKGLDRLFNILEKLHEMCDAMFINQFTALKIELRNLPQEEHIINFDTSEAGTMPIHAVGAILDSENITEENIFEEAISEENSEKIIAEDSAPGANSGINDEIASLSEEVFFKNIDEYEAASDVVEADSANSIEDKYRKLIELTDKLKEVALSNPPLKLSISRS